MLLAKVHENRKQLAEKETYFLTMQTKNDSVRGKMCLRKWRELKNNGVPEQKLKTRNFEVFNDGKKEIESSERGNA